MRDTVVAGYSNIQDNVETKEDSERWVRLIVGVSKRVDGAEMRPKKNKRKNAKRPSGSGERR